MFARHVASTWLARLFRADRVPSAAGGNEATISPSRARCSVECTLTLSAALTAAAAALRTAGIEVRAANTTTRIDPAHETTIGWAPGEAVANLRMIPN